MTMTFLFWSCLGFIAYTYFIYPGLVMVFSRLFPGQPEVREGEYPLVSMVVAAYNEEAVLEQKIQNCRQLDYPLERIEFLFGSDASTDRTNDILEAAAADDDQMRAFLYQQRRGKSGVLNQLVPEARGEILIFSDANSQYHPDAARRIAHWFSDPEVGGVCGRLRLINSTGEPGGEGEGLYWRYEDKIKQAEGELHSVISANGAIFSIRRELFSPLPTQRAVNDDLILTSAVIRQGKRVIYDPQAVAEENTSPDMKNEFRRKIRINLSSFNSLPEVGRILHPRYGFSAWAFFSHKILRWMVPILGLGMLASNLLLLTTGGIYPYLMGGQLLVYLGALLGFLGDLVWGVSGPFIAFYYLAMINLAIVLGVWRTLFGEKKGAWGRIPR